MVFPFYAPIAVFFVFVVAVIVWGFYRRHKRRQLQGEVNLIHPQGAFASSGSPGVAYGVPPDGVYGANQYPPQSQYPAQYPQQQYSPAQQYGGAPAGGVYNYNQAPSANAGHGAVYGQPALYSAGAPPSNNDNLYNNNVYA